jgi:hypothetical protein
MMQVEEVEEVKEVEMMEMVMEMKTTSDCR